MTLIIRNKAAFRAKAEHKGGFLDGEFLFEDQLLGLFQLRIDDGLKQRLSRVLLEDAPQLLDG